MNTCVYHRVTYRLYGSYRGRTTHELPVYRDELAELILREHFHRVAAGRRYDRDRYEVRRDVLRGDGSQDRNASVLKAVSGDVSFLFQSFETLRDRADRTEPQPFLELGEGWRVSMVV